MNLHWSLLPSGGTSKYFLYGKKKILFCQKWDSNPRLQGRLRPERSALDRSAILTDGSPQASFDHYVITHINAMTDIFIIIILLTINKINKYQ